MRLIEDTPAIAHYPVVADVIRDFKDLIEHEVRLHLARARVVVTKAVAIIADPLVNDLPRRHALFATDRVKAFAAVGLPSGRGRSCPEVVIRIKQEPS